MIPKIIHFVFGLDPEFGGKPFLLHNYLAIKSAYEVNKPDAIMFHYFYEPTGPWWEKSKPYLTMKKLDSIPDQIFGNRLNMYAHKADVIRLEVLLKYGGYYIDIDTICKKSVEPLLHHKCVMSEEPLDRDPSIIFGLCNAAILAEPESEFIRIWYNSYRTFRGGMYDGVLKHWAEHGVEVPGKLAKQYPELIHIEPATSFLAPLYFETKKLFDECHDYPAYSHHLWESFSWPKLRDLTEEKIKTVDTTYNLVARRFL